MRILIIHERYRHRGGEDAAVDAELALFTQGGVAVDLLLEDNRRMPDGMGLGVARHLLWSSTGHAAATDAIRRFRPDIVHVHNTFPLLSPSVHGAAQALGVPTVQTLHNFRLFCANALLLRDGKSCETCLGRTVPWAGVVHACYRDSIVASAAMAALIGTHNLLGTWRRKVDRFVALSPTSARTLVAGGLPPDRITVSPPVVPDPGPGPAQADNRAGALFVGRLSPEKGLATVLAAWRQLPVPMGLDVIGDAPDADGPAMDIPPGVRFLGRRTPAEVSQAMAQAALLVFPTLARENFPLVVAEAMAHGLPVLASAGGAVEDMLENGVTGHFAKPGEPEDWSRMVADMMADPAALRRMGRAARATYAARYAPPHILAGRLALYRRVLADRAGRSVPGA